MWDTATGGWTFGLSLVVLGWTDGKRRMPLAFLPYFGEESKLDLALALLEWAKEAGAVANTMVLCPHYLY